MTFNCCQKPFFSHKRAQSLSKNLFLPLFLRKTMLLRRDICKSFAYICKENRLLHVKQRRTKANKTGYLRPTGLYSKPVGAKEAYELRRHFRHTGGTQKQRLPQPTKWRQGERQGSRLRTLRLTGELDSHGYRHHPEHTGKRLALFPLISKRSFYVTLSSPTCLVGFGGVCLQTLDSRAGSYCSL